MPTRSRALTTLAIVATIGLTAACGTEESPTAPQTPPSSSSSSSAGTPPADAKTVEITFTGDTVTPAGEKLEVRSGQELVLEVHADKPGELHLHSSPEQEIAYPAGDSRHPVTLDRPGVYELESHTLDKLVLQLEVR